MHDRNKSLDETENVLSKKKRVCIEIDGRTEKDKINESLLLNKL